MLQTRFDDPGFFESIRRRFRRKLKQVRLPAQSGRFETSDVVQDGCLQIWRDLQRQDSSDSQIRVESAWLRTIAIGHLCKFYRRSLAGKRSERREDRTVDATRVGVDKSSPDEIAEKRELAFRLVECLGELDDRERVVMVRRFFDEQTFDAIAGEMELSRYRVCEIYRLALRKLHRQLSS